jgi:hypothetical protein
MTTQIRAVALDHGVYTVSFLVGGHTCQEPGAGQ